MDAPTSTDSFLFGRFRLDVLRGLLRRDDAGELVKVSLGSRALAVLRVLVERHGELVSKDEIMTAVWPNTTVEEANLTMQISTLRRILDAGLEGESCIQTLSGRGYRFVGKLISAEPVTAPAPRSSDVPQPEEPPPRRPILQWMAVVLGGFTVLAMVIAWSWHAGWLGHGPPPPRLSIVVLSFQNLSGDPKDDYLADGITDDLTSDLSDIRGARVAARETAYTFKGKPLDVRKIGEALGVRYVLEGSVRRIEDTLRVNVQLTSAESGLHLWSDRFDEPVANLNVGQEQIVTHMRDELGISLVEIENARSLRERPTSPDAFDLVLRARSIKNLPWSPQRMIEARALFERALVLDPNSTEAMAGIAYSLTDAAMDSGWGRYENMERAGRLLAKARELEPASGLVLNTYVYWLRTVGRCPEVIELVEQALRTDPNRMRVWTGVYNELAVCKLWAGHAEEALALQAEADRLNPLSPFKFNRYHQMGWALLLLGRVPDATTFLERAIAMNTNDPFARRWLVAAYAMGGRLEEAKRYLTEGQNRFVYDTVRSYALSPGLSPSNVFTAQIEPCQEALRLAGLRDHADEDADFGVPADSDLHTVFAGHTPMSALGATTIRTAELARFVTDGGPLVINTVSGSHVLSIPGSVGLAFSGLGGSLTDEAQDRLRSKLRDLTSGDLHRPIVAVGWNSERFDGRNLALRLVALGYTRVYWYRGGREAWKVAGLPETEVDLQDW